MAPEVVHGEYSLHADMWSFGCVLYESLTGISLFAGETVSDSLAAILRKEPDWSKLPAETPPMVRLLLRRCLTGLHVQRIEIDRLQDELGEPATLHRACNGLARIREQDVRAEATDDGGKLFFLVTVNLEQPCLLDFSQEHGLVFVLDLDRDRQQDLIERVVTLYRLVTAAEVEVGLGLPF